MIIPLTVASTMHGLCADPAPLRFAGAGAIIQMTRCAALDSAKHGVRVNAVCPGPILTEGTARHAASLGVSLEQACADMTSRQILPRRVPSISFLENILGVHASDDVCTARVWTCAVDAGHLRNLMVLSMVARAGNVVLEPLAELVWAAGGQAVCAGALDRSW